MRIRVSFNLLGLGSDGTKGVLDKLQNIKEICRWVSLSGAIYSSR